MAYTYKHGDRPLEGLTVQRAVGRGGFGEVYYAVADSGKQLALKYLRENPEIELRGIAHVMNLKSPHLITIYDVKRNETGEPFVLMEYVGGPSLREMLLAEPNGMPRAKVAFLVAGICKGLSYLHERGIVHRDLKPANIFYDDGYVKIGDYGLSKHLSVSKHSGQTVSVGTVHYMAPEIGSGNYTKAIDIYAVGVILFEMLTGRLPFAGSSMAEILMRHLRDTPDLAGVPQPFARVIARCLQKQPEDRYADADELLAEIMDSEELAAGVAAFDASAITQTPRAPEARDPETVTSPAHRPPPLDVRDNVPVGIPVEEEPYGYEALPQRVQKKMDRIARKIERKVGQLEKKLGPRRERRRQRVDAYGQRGDPRWPGPDNERIARGPHFVVLLLVTVGIAAAMGFIGGHGHRGMGGDEVGAMIGFGLLILGGTLAPLLTHLALGRSPARHPLLDRLGYACAAGMAMLPGIGILAEGINEEELAATAIGVLVMLVLFDWTKRLNAGRAGEIEGWSAFWPAVCGLVVMNVVGAQRAMWHGAALCAAVSVLSQAAAAMWPLPSRRRSTLPGPGGPPDDDDSPPPRDDWRGVRPPPPPPDARAAYRGAADEHRRDEWAEHNARQAHEAPPPEQRPVAAPPPRVDAAAPSFTVRRGRPGLGVLGKVLLMVGVMIGITQGFARYPVQAFSGDLISGPHGIVQRVRWHTPGPPAGLVVAATVVGGLLLVLSRRRESLGHLLRGIVGCAFLIGAVSVILNEGTLLNSLEVQGMNHAARNMAWAGLMRTGVLVSVGLLLLSWRSSRGKRTIVV